MVEADLPGQTGGPRKYRFADRGEGMFYGYGMHDCSRLIVDTLTHEAWELVATDGSMPCWDRSAVTDEALRGLSGEAKMNVEQMVARYGFCVNNYRDGMVCVSWTLRPDGRYWSDSGGFGGTNDEEIELCALIDRRGRIVVPFQNVDYKVMESMRPGRH